MNLVSNDNYLSYWHSVTDAIWNLIEITRPITSNRLEKNPEQAKRTNTKTVLLKIVEEVMEAFTEYQNNSSDQIDEQVDIQMSFLALCHTENLTYEELKFAVGRTLAKFKKRGWI